MDPTTTQTPPSPDYLDRLTREYDTHIDAIEEIVDRAKTDSDRILTPAEDTEMKGHEEAAQALVPQLERFKRLRETRTQVTRVRESAPAAVPHTAPSVRFDRVANGSPTEQADPNEAALRKIHRTAGQFVRDRFLSVNRGDSAASERIQRALAHMLTADTPGLLPIPFVGDLLGRITAVRPLVESANRQPLPAAGMTFKRPQITQHTAVDVQAVEKTEVASQKMIVGSLDIALETLAGAVNMSIQEIERTDPSALDLVFQDLAAQYGKRSELRAAEEYAAGTATSESVGPIDDTATVEQIREALFAASGLIYAGTDGEMPNVIYASMDMWALLGKYARAINPQDRDVLGSPNSLQLSIAGLPVVVSPALAAGTLDIGRSNYLEVYETPGAPVQLRALEVGILGWEVGVYGMFAAAVTNPEAFVHLGAGGS